MEALLYMFTVITYKRTVVCGHHEVLFSYTNTMPVTVNVTLNPHRYTILFLFKLKLYSVNHLTTYDIIWLKDKNKFELITIV